MSEFTKQLGARIREVRKNRLHTQESIADALHIARDTWSRYERGAICPSAEVLSKICDGLDVSADWLMFGLSLEKRSRDELKAIQNLANSLASRLLQRDS